ncbi:predicted protein [Lichtheimia corymbifera JMRC:FSU:9682]|uniref:Uncharacterized protein n=1 Tax=Lichtheimia corymbifera JMRC:FSU:9682 TaxID=1263082 RepID=A0A068SFR2_9FUNG|nr:predicted protein [Lichtheimia corymbifera JMRC:FSU:9682]
MVELASTRRGNGYLVTAGNATATMSLLVMCQCLVRQQERLPRCDHEEVIDNAHPKGMSSKTDNQVSSKADNQVSSKTDNQVSSKTDNQVSSKTDNQVSSKTDNQGTDDQALSKAGNDKKK